MLCRPDRRSRIRIVAEGFVGTNEIRFDARKEWLYVVESKRPSYLAIALRPDGTLGGIAKFLDQAILPGTPDGFAFEVYGNLWIPRQTDG